MTKTNHQKGNVLVGVAVVVGLLALGMSVMAYRATPAAPTANDNVGTIRNVPDVYSEGVQIGTDILKTVKLTVGAGDDQVSLRNTTGRTWYVSDGETGFTSGTASSTFRMSIVSTTTSPIADGRDYSAATPLAGNNLLMTGLFATSTTATTSNSFKATGTGLVKVADGDYLICYVNRDTACVTNGGYCEQATSTNRGVTNFYCKAQIRYEP